MLRVKSNAVRLGYREFLRMYDHNAELMQAGAIAAWQAIESYSPDKGKTFNNYVLMGIAYAMKSCIRTECDYLSHFLFELNTEDANKYTDRYFRESDRYLHESGRMRTKSIISDLEASGALDIQIAYRCLAGKPQHMKVIHLRYQEGLSFAAIARGGYLGRRTSREWPRVLHAEAVKLMHDYMTREARPS